MSKEYIDITDLTPTWSAISLGLAASASNGNSDAQIELVRMGTIADRASSLTNALNVLVLSPNIRAFLKENDPKALEQADKALGIIDHGQWDQKS